MGALPWALMLDIATVTLPFIGALIYSVPPSNAVCPCALIVKRAEGGD
jgi:hypothetical protein